MKHLVNQVLRPLGFQIIRSGTVDDLIRLRDAQPFFDSIYGHKMHVDPNDAGLRLAALNGAEPSGEDLFFLRHIKPGQTVLDLGANIGLYTLLFARLVGPTGRVIAFEPGPKSYPLLKRNIDANGYTTITAENAAVADRSGMTELFVCQTGESDNRLSSLIDASVEGERVPVRCIAMDDYVGELQIDLVKIDIQGSEMSALAGMRKTIARNKSITITLEFCTDLIDQAAFRAFMADSKLSMFDMYDAPLTLDRLLAAIGGPGQPHLTNIVLRH